MLKDITNSALTVIFVGLVFIFFLAPAASLVSGLVAHTPIDLAPHSILGHPAKVATPAAADGNFRPDAVLDISQVRAG